MLTTAQHLRHRHATHETSLPVTSSAPALLLWGLNLSLCDHIEMNTPRGELKHRRVARLVTPNLAVCRLGRALAEQDAQHLRVGDPLGQSAKCQTPCHLWNVNNVSTEKGVSETVPKIPDSSATLSDEPALATRNGRAPGSWAQRIVVIALWVLGFIILAGLGVLVHFHTAPWPFELAFTKSLQGPHPIPCLRLQQPRSPLEAAFFDVSLLNNPLPSVIGGAVWVAGMLLLRLWRQAITFVLAVASVGGLFLFLTPLVGRPRPTINYGICVHDHYAYFSFPSGHVSHDVVCYGFLLYVTLSEPVRRWRYRWLLIPFQLLFVFDLLTIGYSRVLEGDHWLLDVTGGYLVGLLWLSLFIFLYRWAINRLERHRRQKMAYTPGR